MKVKELLNKFTAYTLDGHVILANADTYESRVATSRDLGDHYSEEYDKTVMEIDFFGGKIVIWYK